MHNTFFSPTLVSLCLCGEANRAHRGGRAACVYLAGTLEICVREEREGKENTLQNPHQLQVCAKTYDYFFHNFPEGTVPPPATMPGLCVRADAKSDRKSLITWSNHFAQAPEKNMKKEVAHSRVQTVRSARTKVAAQTSLITARQPAVFMRSKMTMKNTASLQTK